MRNYRLLTLAMVCLLAGSSMAHAQRGRRGGGFSLFEFSYEFISPSAVEGLGLARNPNMEVEVTTLEIKLNLPPIGLRGRGRDREDREFRMPRWMILHSLGFHQRRADYLNLSTSPGVDRLDRVNGIEYTMNLVLGITRGWRAVVQLNPGLFSDLEGDIDSDHWKIRSAMLLDQDVR